MPGSSFGQLFRVTTFGESHGVALGAIVEGCPAGLALSEKDIQNDLDRRRPGTKNNPLVSPRQENDHVQLLSGVFEGKTLGSPIALVVFNENQAPKDYDKLKDVFRPGHADYTTFAKYGLRDYRGGGRSSGRETVGRVMAGAIAKKLLTQVQQTKIIGYTRRIHTLELDEKRIDYGEIEKNPVRCPDPVMAKKMTEFVLAQKNKGNSVGGAVEIVVKKPPVGLGEPVFDKLEADLAKALMSIGTVKGVEIGKGFGATEMLGSEHNDTILAAGKKTGESLKTKANIAGGIQGGISTGEDIIIRIAVKPTSSIPQIQQTVTTSGKKVNVSVAGRHDACILPRLIPVAESMVALVLADHYLRQLTTRLQ